MEERSLQELKSNEFYVDPENPHCPEAGWNVLLKINFLNDEKLKSGNRKWKSREEITTLIAKIKARETYDAERIRLIQLRGGRDFGKNGHPPHLKALKAAGEAIKAFSYNKKMWTIKKSEDGEEYLNAFKVSEKTGQVSNTHLLPLEDSYEENKMVHLEDEHCGASDLDYYFKKNELSGYPRELLKCFPKYCLVCRERAVLKRIEQNQPRYQVANVREMQDIGSDGENVLLLSISPNHLKRPGLGNIFLLKSVFSKTDYLMCQFVQDLEVEGIVSKLCTDLVHIGFPNKIHISVTLDGEEYVDESEVRHFNNEPSRLVSVLSKYGFDSSFSYIELTTYHIAYSQLLFIPVNRFFE